jgi:hypothetical protein
MYRQNCELALAYAKRKWAVYPVYGIKDNKCLCNGMPNCRPGKHPYSKAVPHGSSDASCDETLIRQWFPTDFVNVGINVSASCLLIIDFDVRKGGLETLKQWEGEHGTMPLTPTVQSGSSGRHYYFNPHPLITHNNNYSLPGVDIVANGGVIAPPSMHECGERYTWLTPLETSLADCPAWLVKIITDATHNVKTHNINPMQGRLQRSGVTFETLGDLPSGERNTEVNRCVGSMLNAGFTSKQIIEAGEQWAEEQNPPYSINELHAKVNDFARKEEQKREHTAVTIIEQDAELADGCEVIDFANSPIRSSPEATPPTNPVKRLNINSLNGIFADYVNDVSPHTEADPIGVLLSVMTAFGSAVGRMPNLPAGRRHRANLFVLLCGDTADRKGTAWDVGSKPIVYADSEWAKRINHGYGSGEGLIDAIRDDASKTEAVREKGAIVAYTQIAIPGVKDKRLLIVEEEFDKVLRLCRRENSTLSPLLRSAWDGSPMQTMNKGGNAAVCREPHVSTLACVTPQELRTQTAGRSEMFNGFINRFLTVVVKRASSLPFGGAWEAVAEDYAERFREAIRIATSINCMQWSDEAKAIWREEYERLSSYRDPATARAADHTLRLALLFALADGISTINAGHLQSALAVYDYCHASTLACWQINVEGGRTVFITDSKAHTPSLTEKLLQKIRLSPGMSRTQMHDAFHRKLIADELTEALNALEANELIYSRMVDKVERWFPKDNVKGITGCGGVSSEDAEANSEVANSAKSKQGQFANSPLRQFANFGVQEVEQFDNSPIRQFAEPLKELNTPNPVERSIAYDASGQFSINGHDATSQNDKLDADSPPKAGCCGLGWHGDENACGGKLCVWWGQSV